MAAPGRTLDRRPGGDEWQGRRRLCSSAGRPDRRVRDLVRVAAAHQVVERPPPRDLGLEPLAAAPEERHRPLELTDRVRLTDGAVDQLGVESAVGERGADAFGPPATPLALVLRVAAGG